MSKQCCCLLVLLILLVTNRQCQSTEVPNGSCDSTTHSCEELTSSHNADRLVRRLTSQCNTSPTNSCHRPEACRTGGSFQDKIILAKEELARDGVAVIPGVLTPEECDDYITNLHQWLDKFSPNSMPGKGSSLIHAFNSGFHPVAWMTRLKAAPVFESLWGTAKLMTSVDAIAVGQPPEMGYERFADEGGSMRLHLDQGPQKEGLHAYQGAVYLEDADEDDWCLAVMNGSQNFFKEFYAARNKPTPPYEHLVLKEDERQWYKDKGCSVRKVSVPKGGIVLWDSRTVHAGSKPERNRKHPGRWRYVVFVCMVPAIWANAEEIAAKKHAYKELILTRHWAAQGFETFRKIPDPPEVNAVNELPEIAKTEKARLLVGDLEYDFNDGKPNGGDRPIIR